MKNVLQSTWVGLDILEKKKIYACLNSNPESPHCSLNPAVTALFLLLEVSCVTKLLIIRHNHSYNTNENLQIYCVHSVRYRHHATIIYQQNAQNFSLDFYVHATVHRNKFLYNKTNQMHQFPKFTPAWNSTCFGQSLCLSSEVYSLYSRHWYMSYRFVDSFRAGPGWNSSPILVLLESCMTQNSADCTVNKLLIMGRWTARNM